MPVEYEVLAEVVRNGFVESVHYGSVSGLAPDGSLAHARGDVHGTVLPRSTTKPFQALACLTADAPLTGDRLAIAAGSHTGEDFHVKTVAAILADAGLGFDALQCPATPPEDERTRAALIRDGEPDESRERMNCSGKHAAMLAACVVNDWPVETYLDPNHPLQQGVRTTMADAAGERPAPVAVDGCGAPLFGLTLTGLARAAQSLVLAKNGPYRAVADAMREYPEYVGGTGHLNTELMKALPGSVVKGGAEGVLIAATAEGHAVAVKVIDGSPRATTAIAVHALAALGAAVTPAAAELAAVPILGGGRVVGEIRTTESVRQKGSK
ncbi:asparaginase [Actinomadura rudentiformis]|uniref:Asparaginase n=1 Tax=Actinomadura rudentiformis TaxID=359158 RepID=A0A6H9YIS0_9ACTN|nr:asparaginase [Actinomadura rudentiformis]KAB2341032.1 asparaginase [Actinomadura rudentiformis]